MGKSKNRRKKPRSGSRRRKRRAIEPVDGRAQSLLEGLADQLAGLTLGPCFVSEGWEAEGAMVSVCVTRQLPRAQLVVIVFLVDLACLGVKSIIVKKMGEAELPRFCASFNPPFERAQPALAVKIVTTGVAYAEQFDLSPAPEYELARLIFGDLNPEDTEEVIRTGMKGKPCYIAGPHDDAEAIMAHLMETLGADNFHFIAAADDLGIRF